MPFCSKCGSEIAESSQFCSKCGKQTGSDNSSNGSAQMQELLKSKTHIVFIGGFALALFCFFMPFIDVGLAQMLGIGLVFQLELFALVAFASSAAGIALSAAHKKDAEKLEKFAAIFSFANVVSLALLFLANITASGAFSIGYYLCFLISAGIFAFASGEVRGKKGIISKALAKFQGKNTGDK